MGCCLQAGMVLLAAPLAAGVFTILWPTRLINWHTLAGITAIWFSSVCLPHFIFVHQNRRDTIRAAWVFLVSQVLHFFTVFVVAFYLYWLKPANLIGGMVFFLILMGAFLVFQLASLGLARFCVNRL
ncbi:MAG: hypothetical protein KDK39_01660 [Leptospiraceae bacterium]|nr:hypothetical protein [Leptospiraceae bacterium]